MFEKNASSRYPINELARKRWSGRAYDPDRTLTGQQIITLLEAARWAPSCFGDEPWRYIVCNRDTRPGAWQKALESLTEANQDWAKLAPVIILGFAGSVLSRNGKPNRWGQYDTGAATMSLCLQATAMDLMVHQMGGFDVDKVRSSFTVPEEFTPMVVLTVGYQLPMERIPEQLQERETAARVRRPLEQTFFDGSWDKPVTE
jgi:nitroreductase